jgi:hypothetical protein
VLSKPSHAFFELAVKGLGLDAADVVMIGDDAEADVGGAMAAGLMGILVQTGKCRLRPGDASDQAADATRVRFKSRGRSTAGLRRQRSRVKTVRLRKARFKRRCARAGKARFVVANRTRCPAHTPSAIRNSRCLRKR